MSHKHRATSCGPDRAFGGPVAKGDHENRAAHGGITREERCSCGATRRLNINGCHEEVGPWVEPPGPRRAWFVYHGGSLHGTGRWSGPHRSLLEAQRSARRCRLTCGGAPIVAEEEVDPS